jgi:hypothetical protein
MTNLCVRCNQTGPIDRMVMVINPYHNGPNWIEVCTDCLRLGDRVVGPEDEGDAVIEAVQTAIQHVPEDQEGHIGSVLYGPCDGFFGQHHYGAWVIEAEGKDYIVARALDKQEAAGPRVAVFHPTHDRRALIEKWGSEESRRLWTDED